MRRTQKKLKRLLEQNRLVMAEVRFPINYERVIEKPRRAMYARNLIESPESICCPNIVGATSQK